MVRGFSKGQIYRHASCLDVDWIAVKHSYAGSSTLKVRFLAVYRPGRGMAGMVPEPIAQSYKVDKQALQLWTDVTFEYRGLI